MNQTAGTTSSKKKGIEIETLFIFTLAMRGQLTDQ